MPKFGKIIKPIKIVLIFLLAIVLIPSAIGLTRALIACKFWKSINSDVKEGPYIEEVKDIKDYYRDEDKTYLTLPEWYIVYSTDEYANFISSDSSSNFPYFKAVNQYWQSYVDSCKVVAGRYPFNNSHQFTLGFIGVSFTAENMIKGIYEFTIGRMFGWTAQDKVEEEIYAADVAKDYGNFLHMTPWYFYPFGDKLKVLWNDIPFWGPYPLRKWERKFMLTLEYGGKALYSGFTNWAAKTTYGGADTEKIYAVTEGIIPDMESENLEVIEELDGGNQLTRFTRFETFNKLVVKEVENGLRFVEIAGNDEILVTVLGPRSSSYSIPHAEYLFELPILTTPGSSRIALKVLLSDLPQFLSSLKSSPLEFEHMYDY